MDYTEIFKKSAQEQIIIKRKRKFLQSINQSDIKSMLNRTKTLTFLFCQQSPSFLCQCSRGTVSCEEGMRVENLEQKVIKAGYEENTEEFQTAQMFSDIFHCRASQSPCLCVWAAWHGPGSAACLTPWAAVLLTARPSSQWEHADVSTNEALQTFPSSGTCLYWLSLALNAV